VRSSGGTVSLIGSLGIGRVPAVHSGAGILCHVVKEGPGLVCP